MRLRTDRLSLLCFFPFIFLYGCSHYYYVANVQNVPMLSEKGESRISGFYAFGDESQSVEVQGAYSVNGKIGILADFMSAWGGDVSERDYGKGTYFDGALGYHKNITDSWMFEFYGGLGGSSQHHEYSSLTYNSGTFSTQYSGSSDLSFAKLFVQPSFGFKNGIIEFDVSARLTSVSFLSVNNYATNENDYNELNTLSEKGQLMFEPAATLRLGWKNIMLQAQGLYNGYLGGGVRDMAEEAHLSIGLILRFKGNPEKQQ